MTRFFDSLRFRVALVAALVFALASALVLAITVSALWSATADRVADEARAVADRVASELAAGVSVSPSQWEPSVPMQLSAQSMSGSRVVEGRVGVDVVPRDSAAPPAASVGPAVPELGVVPVPGALHDTTTTSEVPPPSGPLGAATPPVDGMSDGTGDQGSDSGRPNGEGVDEGVDESGVFEGPDRLPAPALPESAYDVEVRRPDGSSEGFVRVSRTVGADGEVWEVEVTATLASPASTIDVFSTLATRSVPGLVVAFALLVWLMVGAALRQVEHVRAAAETMSGAGTGQRLPLPATGDELHQLTETVNGLLDRIDSARADQQQFISDASHELRSPISTIRALCELAESQGSGDPVSLLAGRVAVEAQRLDLLVADLLELARLSEGQSATVSEVDLDELVFTEASRAPAHIVVDTSRVTPLRVLGSERRWSMVVRNLVGNAGRYADSVVRVSLDATPLTGGSGVLVRLEVDDDGPGVPPADRERVFGRFVRLDEGRARDAGGTGLGLAVVSDVVAAMGGTRDVSASASLGGAKFSVSVPAVLTDDGSDDLEVFDDDGFSS